MVQAQTMSIAVVDKAFSILEVLARTGRELTLAELAAEGRMPKPTVYRILKSLRDLGYVEQADRGGAYALSGRLASLRAYGRDEVVRQKALPVMTRLHVAFDETVNLGVLEGLTIRYAHVIETTQPLRWIVKPGARDAFHTTALGRAIVAHLPGEQQSRLVTKACATMPARGRKLARAGLEKELASTCSRGCALEEEETVAGVACVAISLDFLGEPLAAVSVSVPVHRFPAPRRSALIGALLAAREAAVAHA
ncbi:MAG: IclR family transcriptional regulator [Opitutia bacterium]|nr:IclR family transcriptional regulator [Opitutaceae bacterium]PHX85191.1 MAG: IclR family transcriptional regulator [Opitutae bacterium]